MKLEALIKLFHELNTAGVRYLVAGGLAVIAHGFTRLTMDVDIVVSLEQENVKRALNLFTTMGYQPKIPVPILEFVFPEKRAIWISEKNMVVFSLFSNDPVMPPLDIFASEPFDFNAECEKAEAYEIDTEVWIPIVSLETLISMKKQANRDKDKIDIIQLTQFVADTDNEND
jgi:hypothetical protein